MHPPDAPSTRHQEISRTIRDELNAGVYGAEGRLPSEAQLVRRFGVSRPTAARALRTLAEDGLIERRSGSGTFAKLGDAKNLPTSSRLLALLIPDMGNTEIFQLISGEIASLSRVHNYSLIWGDSAQPKLEDDLDPKHAEYLCEQFIQRNVSGVFLVPYELVPKPQEINERLTTLLREAGIPVVLIDRDIRPFPGRSNHDLVTVDNFSGGFLLGEHLLKLGCRSIHFVTRPLSAPSTGGRIAGVREALAQRRIEPDPGWVHTGEPTEKAFVRSLVSGSKVDAFVCTNDHTAAMLLRGLQQLSVKVPQDVRVVGFDDAKFATLVSPPLTTVLQPYQDIALAAFRAMTERQAESLLPARHITITPRLVVRDSCGAYLPRK